MTECMLFDTNNRPTKRGHSFSAVYQIRNRVNGKIYVGSARNFWQRFHHYAYFEKCRRNVSPGIGGAILKYGFSSFEFSILEIVESAETVLDREQYYLDTLQPFNPVGYNQSRRSNSWFGNRHSEETKRRIALINKGRKRTEAQKERLSEINKNRDPEVQRKMDEAIRKSWASGTRKHRTSRPIIQFDPVTLLPLQEFSSTVDAAKLFGGTYGAILLACKGKTRTAFGYIWRLKSDYDVNGLILLPPKRRGCPHKHITPIVQKTLDGEIVRRWDCLKDVCLAHRYDGGSIAKCCKGKKESYNGFLWEYETDPTIIAEARLRRQLEHQNHASN